MNELPFGLVIRIIIRFKENMPNYDQAISTGWWDGMTNKLVIDSREHSSLTPDGWIPVYDEL
jgi:hypothetical protein